MKIIQFTGAGIAVLALGAGSFPAFADDGTAAESTALTQPAMSGPLAANPNPIKFAADPLGDVSMSGFLSGFGQVQSNRVSGDRSSQADVSNAMIAIQKTDGLVQFFVQGGAYSLPALGTAYTRATKAVDDLYGVIPVAYAKLAPSEAFSIQAGKLPTLIGAEYTFTFENANLERGLLWNQESAISQGVQVNYTTGPLALSLAWTDGFYSGRLNWISGSATYTIDSENALALVGGANAGQIGKDTLSTPIAQNNSQIYNLIYTYSAGPWTLTPYLQLTWVPENRPLGLDHSASTAGGAMMARYAFADDTSLKGVSLPVRVEYISSSGGTSDGAPNLLYGPGSSAWSATITPTYQSGIFFTRAELSYVGTMESQAGSVFGKNGAARSQVRGAIETGIVF